MNPPDWLIEILRCPKCRARVDLTEDASGLVCAACGLRYPIRDGVPVMLVSEAIETDRAKA